MNAGNAPPGCCHDRPATRPKPSHDNIIVEGIVAKITRVSILFELNEVHGDFRRVFFVLFRALLEELNHEAYVRRMADYVRLIQSMYMFVRVERPRGSKCFVLGYMKCEQVFSFAPRFVEMRLRLNRVPPMLLSQVEAEENKALRLASLGETDFERALAKHSNTPDWATAGSRPPINFLPLAAAIFANDEESTLVLLDGGADPNEAFALHRAGQKGCSQRVFRRILDRIDDVNGTTWDGETALSFAAMNNQLDVMIWLMNAPGVDLNIQNRDKITALHWAVSKNHPRIVAQLLLANVDLSPKDHYNLTPLKLAIRLEHDEIVRILREHGAPEE